MSQNETELPKCIVNKQRMAAMEADLFKLAAERDGLHARLEELYELMRPLVLTIGDAVTASGYCVPSDWREWPKLPWRLTLPSLTYRLYRIASGFDEAGRENDPLCYLMFRGMRVVDGGPDMQERFTISMLRDPKDLV